MPDVQDPRQLFLHELADILYVEKELAQGSLPKLIEEVRDDELKKGLRAHLKQTQRHVSNVERVFRLVGESPKTEPCIGFEGLKREHDRLVAETTPDLIDMVDAGAAARTEHYEIAAYGGLIAMARSLGERQAADLLEQNMKQEKATLREVEKISRRLSRERAKQLATA
jgi:ferritin-like metal-binding protein YciE